MLYLHFPAQHPQLRILLSRIESQIQAIDLRIAFVIRILELESKIFNVQFEGKGRVGVWVHGLVYIELSESVLILDVLLNSFQYGGQEPWVYGDFGG